MKSLMPSARRLWSCLPLFAIAAVIWCASAPVGAAAAAATPTSAAAPGPEIICETGRTIQVSGSATVRVAPDRALIKLGVQTNALSPDAALDLNARTIQKISRAIQTLGVQAQDISTDFYIVYPVYNSYSDLTIKGYRVDNVVAVTLRDISKSGPVLAEAFHNGANEVVDVEFYSSQLRTYRDQARALAMQAAGEKADALARSGGAQAGCMLTATENTRSYMPNYWSRYQNGGNWGQNVVQNISSAAQPADSDDPLALGMISIQADISATFSIK
jgi:uncharacterized protein YggE